jgi:DNA-binding beta-propeller fold protein YncE
MSFDHLSRRGSCALVASLVIALAAPAGALAANKPPPNRQPITALGSVAQLAGSSGCLVDRSQTDTRCTPVRALRGPAPLLGSHALAISPNGENVYVASSGSHAIAIFTRNSRTGALDQRSGTAGCIALAGASGCARAVGLAVVNVTSLVSNSVTTFTRSTGTGQLTQLTGTSACVINLLAVGCSLGRQLGGPEGLAVSPDGASVYVTAFTSGALDVFNRNADSGVVTQKPRAPGCLLGTAVPGCLVGRGLRGVSSVAVSPDGRNVYSVASKSDSVALFRRVTRAMTR